MTRWRSKKIAILEGSQPNRTCKKKDLREIKSLLLTYLADKVTREADKAFEVKEYATEIFEKWKQEQFRKSD
jgi:hypothetical protein